LATTRLQALGDDDAPAKKLRNDNDGWLETREELSLVDEAKSFLGKYGADGTNAGESLLSLMNLSDTSKDEIRRFIASFCCVRFAMSSMIFIFLNEMAYQS
jgi:hypothetical protein